MNPNSKEFKALQAEWDKKLADSGFEDAEKDGYLKVWSRHIFGQQTDGSYYHEKLPYYKAKEKYFEMAVHFLNDHTFKDILDKFIWERHSEGGSMMEIVAELKTKDIHYSKSGIHKIVARLAKLMLESYHEQT